MKTRQRAFAALFTICVVAVVLGGQFAILRHFEKKLHRDIEQFARSPHDTVVEVSPPVGTEPDHSQIIESVVPELASADALIESIEPPSPVPFHLSGVFDRYRRAAGDVQVAATDAECDDPAASAAEPQGPSLEGGHAPDELPHVENAAPIDEAQKRRDERTRDIIAHELPTATAEEREVWFDELKGLEPEMTRELLRLRKDMPHDMQSKIVESPLLPPSPQQPAEGPSFPSRLISRPEGFGSSTQSAIPAIESSIAALRIARDVALNNIANAQTTAFRRSRVLFEDLAYRQIKLPGQQDSMGKPAAVGVAVGLGVQVSGTSLDVSHGQLEKSNSSLHLAIVGDGFFQVEDGTQVLYTRCGAFSKNAQGELVLTSADRGRAIEPPIVIPQVAIGHVISGAGIVSATQSGTPASLQIGQIHLARFANADGLIQKGENLYAQSDASGVPIVGLPGQEGFGTLKQGYLETSNVDLEEELNDVRRLQSRIQALEQARAILSDDAAIPTATPRIAESPDHAH
jgi:flagellar basal-body rod protein FlgG